MLEDLLTITDAQVARKINTPDGMGGMTIATTLTTLRKCAIWSPSQSRSYISEKMARVSTHVLVTIPSYYAFNATDTEIIYGGATYKINGYDDVMNLNEIMMVGLEKIV